MSKRATVLAMVVALSAFCAKAPAQQTNVPVTFYIVSKQSIDGGQFFNRFPFLELGYISSKPDLVVEHLKEVDSLPEISHPGWATNNKTAILSKMTVIEAERFFFTLHDDDAARFRKLAEKAQRQGQLVLVLFGDKAIKLLRMDAIPAKAQFEVAANWGRAGVEEIAAALKNLVR